MTVIDWREAFLLTLIVRPTHIGFSLLFLVVAYAANGARLALLQLQLGLTVPPALFAGTYYTGLMMNHVLPAGVGGDLVRIAILAERGYSGTNLVLAGVLDRYLGLVGLLVVLGVALLIAPDTPPISESATLFSGMCLLTITALSLICLPRLSQLFFHGLRKISPGKLKQRVEIASHSIERVMSHQPRMVLPFVLSLTSHLCMILSYVILGSTLLPNVSFFAYLLAVSGVMLILTLPVGLGGLGVREASAVGLLVWMGADLQAALALSALFLIVAWLSVIPGFVAALNYGFGLRKIKEMLNA